MYKTKFLKLFLTAFVKKLSKWKGSETQENNIVGTQYYALLLLIYQQQKLNTAIILGIHRFLTFY